MTALCGALDFDGRSVDARVLQAMASAVPFGAGARVETWTSGAAGLAIVHPRAPLGRGGGFLVREGSSTLLGDGLAAEDAPARDARGRAILGALAGGGVRLGSRLAECGLRCGFALALVDGARGSLTLARDEAGERALYWLRHDGRIWFATEPVQLLAVPGVERQLDLTRLVAHLLARDAAPELSFFRGIQRLPEGAVLVASASGQRFERRAGSPGPAIPAPAAGGELAACLEAAVRRRLPAQGEAGVLLSGGLDSATVAYEAARALANQGRSLHAFTWASRSEADIDERATSGQLIDACPNIVEHVIEADELWPLRPGVARLADECDPESNALPELLAATVAAARARGVEVLFNGSGGDAVVGWSMPDPALLVSGRWGALARRWRRAGLLASLRGSISPLRRRSAPSWLTEEGWRLARAAGLDRPLASLRDLASAAGFRRWLLAHSAVAATQERLDRWSRRSGVRLCAPWLDAEMLELAGRLPLCALEVEGPGKSLVREAWRGRLPAPVLDNPTEKGAGMELLRRGLLEEGRPIVEALLDGSDLGRLGLVSARQALQKYSDRAAQRAIMPGLWIVLTAEIWVRAQLGRGAATSREQQ